jgi:hypothetical protein
MRRMPPLNDANGIVMVLQALGCEHVALADHLELGFAHGDAKPANACVDRAIVRYA